jgi:hypothetical protein
MDRCSKGYHRDKKTKQCLPFVKKTAKAQTAKKRSISRSKRSLTASSHKTKTGRCKKGFHKYKKTGECLPKGSRVKAHRCPKGTRKNKAGTGCIGKNNEVFPSYSPNSSFAHEVDDDESTANYSDDFEDEEVIIPKKNKSKSKSYSIKFEDYQSPKKKSESVEKSYSDEFEDDESPVIDEVFDDVLENEVIIPMKKKSTSLSVRSPPNSTHKGKHRNVLNEINNLKKKSTSSKKRNSSSSHLFKDNKNSQFGYNYGDAVKAPSQKKSDQNFSIKKRNAEQFKKNVNLFKPKLRKTKKREGYNTSSLLRLAKGSQEKRQDKLRNKNIRQNEIKDKRVLSLNSDEKNHLNLMYGIKEDKAKKIPKMVQVKKSPEKKQKSKEEERKAAVADKEREDREKARMERQVQMKKEEEEREEEDRKQKMKEAEEKAAKKTTPTINVRDRMKLFQNQPAAAAVKRNFTIAKKEVKN